MHAKQWISASLTALLLATGSTGTAMATQAQVVITSPDLAEMDGVRATYQRMIREGYQYIEVSRSMLGRAVLEAWDGAHKREVVINTTTGEILHDMTEAYIGYPQDAQSAARDAASSAVDTATGLAGIAAGMGDSVAGGIGGWGN